MLFKDGQLCWWVTCKKPHLATVSIWPVPTVPISEFYASARSQLGHNFNSGVSSSGGAV